MEQVITDALDKFSKGALCTWLNRPGARTAVSVLATAAVAVPEPVTTAAGLGLLATQMACAFDPNPPAGDGNIEGQFYNACDCPDTTGYNLVYTLDKEGRYDFFVDLGKAASVTFSKKEFPGSGGDITYEHRAKGVYCNGTEFDTTQFSNSPRMEIVQSADTSLACLKPPVDPNPPGPDVPPPQ